MPAEMTQSSQSFFCAAHHLGMNLRPAGPLPTPPTPPRMGRTPVMGGTPPRKGSLCFSHSPAIGPPDKQPREPFQINSVSITTGAFIKINYLGDVYRREPLGADGRSEGESAGLHGCQSALAALLRIQMCVSPPR